MAIELFKKYYARLAKEALLKALFCCLIAGFSAVLVAASIIFWAIGNQQLLWISAVVGVVVAGGTLPLFYFLKFRPTEKMVMQRIDGLGLEERMITMQQLANDDSYIARRQREDALVALKTVEAKFLKIIVSVPLLVSMAIVAVASVGATTVYAVADKTGKEVLEETINKIEEAQLPEYEVSFEVEGAGEIVDDPFQIVKQGMDAAEVMAVPMEGWGFSHWQLVGGSTVDPTMLPKNDPLRNPIFTVEDVQNDMTYIAVFGEVVHGDDPNNEENNEPSEPNQDESLPQDLNPEQKPSPGNPGEGGGEGGGSTEPRDQVVDGETNFDDLVGDAGETAAGEVAGDGSIGDDAGGAVDGYFGSF